MPGWKFWLLTNCVTLDKLFNLSEALVPSQSRPEHRH